MAHVRMLLVEDNPDDFELINRAMSRAGYTVTSRQVHDEAELLVALAETWDIVLLDWILPRFSAPEAIRVLNQLAPDTPCIVVSGSGGEDLAVMAIRLGARDFMTKDDLEKLPPKIERELMFARRTP